MFQLIPRPRKELAFAGIVGCLLLAGVFSGGCRRNTGESLAPVTSETPRRGGSVVIGLTAGFTGVNELTAPSTVASNQILFRIFTHLLEEQPDFAEHPPTFAPRLAESYGWSEDHKILTFHLRPGLKWSDGAPLTADDVRFSWQAQTHPDIGWEGAFYKQPIRDVEVVDPQTVRFHFTKVYAGQLIDANEGVILPKHKWGQIPFSDWRTSSDWFRKNLVSSGPFKLESWRPNEEIVLARNEFYYDPELPYLERAVIRVVPDQSNLATELLAGNLDVVNSIFVDDAERLAAEPGLEVIKYWNRSFQFISWNIERPKFADRRVRQALTLGIDRQGLVDAVWGSNARVADSPILRSVWAHNDDLEPWPYDPKRARGLLAEAGWRDHDGDGVVDRGGESLSFEISTNTGNRERANALVIIQQQLKRIGVDARPRLMEFHSLVEQIDAGKLDAVVAGMTIPTNLDLKYFFHSDSIDNALNYSRYRNPEVDRLIDLANSQPEPIDARPYLDKIQILLRDDQPVTFLWESKRIMGINERVQGAEPNVLAVLFNLHEWWLTPQP